MITNYVSLLDYINMIHPIYVIEVRPLAMAGSLTDLYTWFMCEHLILCQRALYDGLYIQFFIITKIFSLD